MYLNLQMKYLGNIKIKFNFCFIVRVYFFYNFTTPEFNVNVCQLPFWSLVVYYSWKIYEYKKIKIF